MFFRWVYCCGTVSYVVGVRVCFSDGFVVVDSKLCGIKQVNRRSVLVILVVGCYGRSCD